MTSTSRREQQSIPLGTLLKQGRLGAELSIVQLSQEAGIAVGQVHKLENDRVQKVNPAHLAALAGPLKVPLYRLYEAAGYPAEQLPLLEPELAQRLRELSPDALASITKLLNEFLASGSQHDPAFAPVVVDDGDDSEEGGTEHE